MRITPPHAEINLYEDGFANHDLLNRSALGRHLSDLVDKVDDPLVISLDGAWGSGKSFFLKCWLGEHANVNDGFASPIYFDAFENDFIEDPLLGLTSMLTERLTASENDSKTIKIIKSAAAKFWRPVFRTGLAAATAGVSEVTGVIVDAALETGSQQFADQVENFWKKEDGRRAAMVEFRSAMVQLTEPDPEGKPTKKFVFVVDELDRCRPDFALDTLEVIKHFFNVPGVHFVLGINFKELLNTVRCRYGDGIDATTYLQKFITVSMTLPEQQSHHSGSKADAITYFEKMATRMELPTSLTEDILWWCDACPSMRFTSLRQCQKVLTEIALVPNVNNRIDRLYPGRRLTLAALILFKHLHSDLYDQARRKTLSLDLLEATLEFPDNIDPDTQYKLSVAKNIWTTILSTGASSDQHSDRGLWGGFGLDRPSELIPTLIRDFIDPIQIFDTNK